MMHEENYYTILGCKENASPEEVKQCFHKKALASHPDKTPSEKDKEVMSFDVVNKAWKTLSDPESRRKYDAELSEKRSVLQNLVFGSFIHSDLTFNSSNNNFNHECRCGGQFVVDADDLNQAVDCDIAVECNTCSLVILVSHT